MKNKEYYIRLGEAVQKLEEKNCPTDPSKWSYYKSQAKKKFDVYPSAYANGWASKQYGDAGGGWKKCASEATDSVNEAKPQFIKVKDTHQSLANGAMKHMDSFVKKIQRGIQRGEKFEISTIVKMRNILDAIENQYGIKESTPDQVIKDLDKAKNDLLKKVDALIAKKKKLYSDVDIEAPMSADEKKLDKDIADLFSQINKLVLQKRSIKKESVNEVNTRLNKKVKSYLDAYLKGEKKNSPEHQHAIMLIMKGALTDANFHSEARQLDKFFPKAKQSKHVGTPMEDVIEDKGVDIAGWAKWDGYDIIDAFSFYTNMVIGGGFGKKLETLKESVNEEQINELSADTYKNTIKAALQRGDSKGNSIAVKALQSFGKEIAKELAGKSFEVKGSMKDVTKALYKSSSYSYINQVKMTFTGEGSLFHDNNVKVFGSDEVHFNMNVQFQLPDNIGGFSSDVKFRGYQNNKIPATVQFSIKGGKVWVWFKEADTDLEFTRAGAREMAKLADTIVAAMDFPTKAKHNTIKQFDAMKPTSESVNEAVPTQTKWAVAIASLTATRPDAVQKFIDDNNLNSEKLYQYLKKSNASSRFGGFAMDFVTAISGKPGNPIQKKMIKMFGESVKEVSNDYSPLAYAKLVANGKMSMEKAIKDTGYPFIILAKLVKAFNRNYKFEGNKPVNEKFDNTHLGLLKYAYKDIDKINPADPMYKRVVVMLDKLSKQELKQIADADIKFLSLLAKNRLSKKESVNESHFQVGDKVKMSHGGVGVVKSLDKSDGADDEKYYNIELPNGDVMKHAPNELTLVETNLEEGLFQDIMKGVKKGNSPFTLVVIKNNKVVKQANVNTPQAIPANYTSLKKEYPNSRIRVEDSTGKIVFGEATDAEEKDFHMKLDKLVHSTFGKSPDEEKKESVVNESSVEIGDTVFLKSANKIATVIDRMGRSVTVKTGDGKKIKTIINNIKTLAQDNVNEGSFSEIDIMAREARNFNEFVKEFYKDFRDFPKDKETIKWLKSLYDGRSTDESINEGNAFTGALFKARKEGLTEFEFNGKMYPVRKLEEEEETPIKESKLSKNDLKKIIKEEYHNVKNFMEEKYGFNPDLGKVYSNPAAKPFLKEEEEEVIEEYDVENYEDLKEFVQFMAEYKADINEAEYQGRKVKLGKIMQGDVKKFKVYVKNDKGNVVKVNFGQGGDAKGGTMRIRKDNPEARKSFRARHNCDNPGPRWKARYWSCRKW